MCVFTYLCLWMFKQYVQYLLASIQYRIDDNGTIVAHIPGDDLLVSQGETYEEARKNLIDAIESVLLYKVMHGDAKTMKTLQKFMNKPELSHA